MNNRKYRTDPQILMQQSREVMRSSEEAKFCFRVFAVMMVLQGCSAAQVGKLTGVSRATVTSWVKSADENGLASLRPGRHPGRPSRLSDEQKAEIFSAIREDPARYGRRTWDGPELAAYIEEIYGIHIGVRQCQRMLRERGAEANEE